MASMKETERKSRSDQPHQGQRTDRDAGYPEPGGKLIIQDLWRVMTSLRIWQAHPPSACSRGGGVIWEEIQGRSRASVAVPI